MAIHAVSTPARAKSRRAPPLLRLGKAVGRSYGNALRVFRKKMLPVKKYTFLTHNPPDNLEEEAPKNGLYREASSLFLAEKVRALKEGLPTP